MNKLDLATINKIANNGENHVVKRKGRIVSINLDIKR
jgi:hypothetical protein